jgi:DNA repair exonuclease SbcCD nuclease subunit
MVKFVHTSDWQLGMTRRFLSPEAQSRFTAARIEAIRTIGEVAARQAAQFVVVAGDVFESNLVDRQLVLRALEAMKEAGCHFYLLPGNHDPLDAGSVYTSPVFAANCPANVTVLDGTPVQAAPGVTLLSAPWRSKKMTADALQAAYAQEDAGGAVILVGHGQIDYLAPDPEKPEIIRLAAAEVALAGGASYIALGDRHSRHQAGSSGRIWYSGAPEPTDFDEDDPGLVLCVELEGADIRVEPVKVGTWRFVPQKASVNELADIVRLRTWLDGLPAKDRTILKLGFEGTVSLSVLAELDTLLDDVRPMFAAIERRDRDSDLAVLPSEMDFSELGLSGFAATAVQELGAIAAEPGAQAVEARDALGLLLRLAKGAA